MIEGCIAYLKETSWDGVLSIECLGRDENIAESVQFLRNLIT